MFMTHLECARCEAVHDCEKRAHLCGCGGPLLVRYNLNRVRETVHPVDFEGREPSLWRYRELLPLRHPDARVSLGEQMTPLLRLRRAGARVGLSGLYMKDEGLLPTGTFKARGAAVGVSRARELGVEALAMPTNGNAGGAWAAYSAAAGIECVIVMPTDAPLIHRKECAVTGATFYLVDGLISDAGKQVAGGVKRHGWYDASTLKEPYRIEGKKTMGLELAEQFQWQLPDVIVYPTGGGVGLIGIHKVFRELQELGWLDRPFPRMVAVQSSGCAPIVRAWKAGRRESEFWTGARTVAFGITVPKALGDFLVLDALYDTGGCAVETSDEEILRAQRLLARSEGTFVCPEGAATLAAARKLAESGWIRKGERVVLLNTGSGLKYPDSVSSSPPVLAPEDSLPC